MHVLLTGGSGHIGANVARILLEKGHTVRALVRRDTAALDGLPLTTTPGDLNDAEALARAVDGVEGVIHCAAWIALGASTYARMHRINVEGTQTLLNAAKNAGVCRFVHMSSVHALQQRPFDEPLDERRALAIEPHFHPYDQTKAASERAVLNAHGDSFQTVILNPTSVIGPFDTKPSRLGRVLLTLRDGRMPALIHAGFDWVDARDVALAAEAALHTDATGQRYLLPGHWHPMRDLATWVHDAGGARPPRMTAPLWLAKTTAPLGELAGWATGQEPLFSRGAMHMLIEQNPTVDGARAAAVLGHAPRPISETVSDTLAWFAAQGR
ncbi:MAG: NAD-dependent epimerase/dehydratase family protein [Myxococcota bacterium]